MEALSFLSIPFLGCLILILIHAYFGIHILERGIIFSDLSMAQFIGLGISLSFYMGREDSGKYLYAIAFAVIGASILSLSRRISKVVNIEAFIGVFYIFSLASSILILDRTPHGIDELKAILNGNILFITQGDIVKMLGLYATIGLVHAIFRKRFFALSFEGSGGYLWEFIFFLSFALVLVSSVSTAGVLQVFSFLVIPALTGKLYTKDPFWILLIGWGTGIAATVLGLILSYRLDIPTAPLIVVCLSSVFLFLLALKAWKGKDK